MELSRKVDINTIIKHAKTVFDSRKIHYMIIRSRSMACETALKVSEIIREQVGGLSSIVRFKLQSCQVPRDISDKHAVSHTNSLAMSYYFDEV